MLAYGQTSSGKTFTMQGDLESETMRGIIPRMVENIFDVISQASQNVEFTVKAAMIEIYNERIRDLLDTTKDNLNVHEDKQKGIYVEGLTELSIGNEFDVYELMKDGNGNRAIAETKMNAQSSRSHSIFVLTMIMNDMETYACKTGKLYLVDLAGSEIISKTGATGQTLEEAKNINKSLTMLGRVITALTDGKSSHIPYRDSKLTRILQDSLGGNSKTCLIVTASPSMYNAVETLSTCRFGVRAKSIKNNAKVNKQLTLAELKLVINNMEKDMAIKAKRIGKLEQFIMAKGLTLEAIEDADDEPERLTTDESAEGHDNPAEPHTATARESKETETSPFKPEVSPPAKSPGSNESPKEEEKKGMDPAQVMKLFNNMEQQRDLVEKPMLEKKNEEQNQDIDTLIGQLRQERKKTKMREERLRALQQELDDRKSEVDRFHQEASSLDTRLQEKDRQVEELQRELRESMSSPKVILPSEAEKNLDRKAFLEKVLGDLADLDPRIKEKISEHAAQLMGTSSEPGKDKPPTPTANEIRLEEEKARLETERRELAKHNEKLRKDVLELTNRLNKERDGSRRLMESNVSPDEAITPGIEQHRCLQAEGDCP